jgi:hypothetical protein
MSRTSRAKPPSPFRYFHSSPEVILEVVMLYVRFPLSLRKVEDLLFERGFDLCHETVRLWWNRFGPLFASEIRRKRVSHMRGYHHWKRWGGRPPSASMCHTEVVADLMQGGRPWNRLAALEWIRRSCPSSEHLAQLAV